MTLSALYYSNFTKTNVAALISGTADGKGRGNMVILSVCCLNDLQYKHESMLTDDFEFRLMHHLVLTCRSIH